MTKSAIQYYKSYHSAYKPLLRLPYHANNYYGSIESNTSDTASDTTVNMDVEIKTSRWTVYNWSRLLISTIQLCLIIHHMQQIDHHKYRLLPNEGKKSDILFALGVRATFWVIDQHKKNKYMYMTDNDVYRFTQLYCLWLTFTYLPVSTS
jgi:hypothetical protein